MLEPLTAVFVIVAGLLLLTLRPRHSVIPLLAVACLVPYGQRLVISGLDFDMLRIMFVVGVLRLVIRREAVLELNRLDKTLLCLACALAIMPVVRSPSAVTWALGFLLDNAVGYLVIRSLLNDKSSLSVVAVWIVLLSVPIGIAMLIERGMEKNLFYIFGSPTEVTIRDGEIRAAAKFDHPILAGTFGALILPFAFVLWNKVRLQRMLGVVALLSSVLIVYTSKSSGPLFSLLAGVLGLALWRTRHHIRTIRNGFWVLLIILQLFMHAPVYALIFRIPDALSFITGSTSYHRFLVIDAAIRNLGAWWLLGTSSELVGTWGYGVQDVTNQFVVTGYGSGLLGVVILVMVLVRGFSMIGCGVRWSGTELDTRKYAWALGSLLFIHVASFFGVSYFSGFNFFFHLTVAMISLYWNSYVATDQASGN